MEKAYISVPTTTPYNKLDNVIKFITENYDDNRLVNWHVKTHAYSTRKLLDADAIFFFLDGYKKYSLVHQVAKGQFTEFNVANAHNKKTIAIDAENNLYEIKFSRANNSATWGKGYAEFHLKEVSRFEVNINQSISKLLLIC